MKLSQTRAAVGSLSEQLSVRIRGEICATLVPGDRLPTLRVLRDRFAVSINTVSAAIDLLSAEGVVEKRPGSGVYMTAQLRRVGILSELNLLDRRIGPSFRELADCLHKSLAELGFEPRLYMGHAEPNQPTAEPTCPQFWKDVQNTSLSAAVILDVPAAQEWRERVRSCRIPVVGFHTDYVVEIDYVGIIHAALQRLAAVGCRRVGLMSWGVREPFLQAVAAYGMETRDAWICSDQDPAVRGVGWDELRSIWLGSDERPDGLVVLDEMLFADAQLAIMDLGIDIPGELTLAVMAGQDAAASIRLPHYLYEVSSGTVAAELTDMLSSLTSGVALPKQRRNISFREIASAGYSTTESLLTAL